jgi:hypothetical protein
MQKLRLLLFPDAENTYRLRITVEHLVPEPCLEHRLAKTHKLLSKNIEANVLSIRSCVKRLFAKSGADFG